MESALKSKMSALQEKLALLEENKETEKQLIATIEHMKLIKVKRNTINYEERIKILFILKTFVSRPRVKIKRCS